MAFPSVTVCYPLTLTKGYSITKTLLHLDQDGEILDALKSEDTMKDFKNIINGKIGNASETYIKTQEYKEMISSDSKSYKVLEILLGSDFQEIGYLIHFLSYNIFKSEFDSGLVHQLIQPVVDRYKESAWKDQAATEMVSTLVDEVCNTSISGIDVEQLCQDKKDSAGSGLEIEKYCDSTTWKVSRNPELF